MQSRFTLVLTVAALAIGLARAADPATNSVGGDAEAERVARIKAAFAAQQKLKSNPGLFRTDIMGAFRRPSEPEPAPPPQQKPLAMAPAATVSGPGPAMAIFGTQEMRNNRLDPFTKWTGMLSRYKQLMLARNDRQSGDCKPSPLFPCALENWDRLIARAKGKPLIAQLGDVNDYMNRTLYITDPKNWGMPDYWATPQEFFRKDGDCEDYAISKYLTLKSLGVDPSRMRIVVLDDRNLGVQHAILAVNTGSDIVILDNQISGVVSHRMIKHYVPIYSINELAWWMHRPPRG